MRASLFIDARFPQTNKNVWQSILWFSLIFTCVIVCLTLLMQPVSIEVQHHTLKNTLTSRPCNWSVENLIRVFVWRITDRSPYNNVSDNYHKHSTERLCFRIKVRFSDALRLGGENLGDRWIPLNSIWSFNERTRPKKITGQKTEKVGDLRTGPEDWKLHINCKRVSKIV